MDSLVEQLREQHAPECHQYSSVDCAVGEAGDAILDAADRIDALEKALRDVMPLLAECDCIHSDREEPLCPCRAARALLESQADGSGDA